MNNDQLPELSHLQFAVLKVLGAAQMSGKDLRTGLSGLGINKSGPAFYQMMARLEEAQFVEGTVRQQIIEGQIIKERLYRITGHGFDAFNATNRFYQADAGMALQPAGA